jgi:hypothetical protein
MILTLSVYLKGILGYFLNRKNFILLLNPATLWTGRCVCLSLALQLAKQTARDRDATKNKEIIFKSFFSYLYKP